MARQILRLRDVVASSQLLVRSSRCLAPRMRSTVPFSLAMAAFICSSSMINVEVEVLHVLDEVLSLGGRGIQFNRHTRLLGAVPELDSMAVVGVITALEERVGITVDDHEIDNFTFATVGSLIEFVEQRLRVG